VSLELVIPEHSNREHSQQMDRHRECEYRQKKFQMRTEFLPKSKMQRSKFNHRIRHILGL
jgi:hypothetical protein